MIFTKKTLIILLFALAGLNVLIFFAALYIDYRILDYADILLHIWGGFSVGLAYCIYFKDGLSPIKSKLVLFLSIVGVVMVVGVGWEWYEWLNDHVLGTAQHLLMTQLSSTDTMKDLLDDFIGGSLVAWLFIKRMKK